MTVASPPTVRDLLRAATARLAEAGCGTPRLDAELLAARALNTDRGGLVLLRDSPLSAGAAERFEALVRRREAREPVAYILGRREFRWLELQVDRRALIPRPETELLVEAALELPAHARVIDVGTGSGAVALALKQERPDLAVTGADISPGALAVARANATHLGLDVAWRRADLLAGAAGPWDAVLANLPYVEPEQWDGLAPEITRYEPRDAVVGGLTLMSRLVAQLPASGAGFAALEVGAGQASAVAQLLRDAGFGDVRFVRDLARHERIAVGHRA
jgi:release factor glutamine methyltransferase